MAEVVQDEEQWLYGDDKDETVLPEKEDTDNTTLDTNVTPIVVKQDPSLTPEKETEETEATEPQEEPSAEPEEKEKEDSNEAEKENQEEESSSDDDEPTVTIGKLVRQPDIVRPLPAHRAAPTSGLKPEDFASPGKINGIPATEFSLAELEEKPWRKPGADLSDYFNYGFTEETWIQYCERQKGMRVLESGVGLASLGIGKMGLNTVPSVMNDNSKYSNNSNTNGLETQGINTIQVMTADRRVYSNKVMNSANQPYDNMDFGLHFGQDPFSVPPPATTFFTGPPPPTGNWINPLPPPVSTAMWPPSEPIMDIPPPPVPISAPPTTIPTGYFNKEAIREDTVREDSRERERESSRRDSMERERERNRDRDRERDSRRHRRRSRSRERSRSRSRSQSRPRHRNRRSRSRSRSPQKHKRKKSKRD